MTQTHVPLAKPGPEVCFVSLQRSFFSLKRNYLPIQKERLKYFTYTFAFPACTLGLELASCYPLSCLDCLRLRWGIVCKGFPGSTHWESEERKNLAEGKLAWKAFIFEALGNPMGSSGPEADFGIAAHWATGVSNLYSLICQNLATSHPRDRA